MNKRIILVMAAFLGFVASAKSQDILNLKMDAQQLGLRGNVASMDEDILIRKDFFRDDWVGRKWFTKDLRRFLKEDQGRELTFDNQGRPVTINYTLYGPVVRKTKLTYNKKGLLTAFSGEGYRATATYKDNIANINVYAETKQYDSKVNLEKDELAYAPYSNVYPFDTKCVQEISPSGRVLRSTYYFVDSMPAKECTYRYNAKGLMTEQNVTEYNTRVGKKETHFAYTYDTKGNLTSKSVKNLSQNDIFTYENNAHGDCERLTVEHTYGNVIYTFEYLYDDHNNWTTRVDFKNGEFDGAIIRNFTYYPDKVVKQKKEKEPKEKVAKEKKVKKEQVSKKDKASKDEKSVKEKKVKNSQKDKGQIKNDKSSREKATKDSKKKSKNDTSKVKSSKDTKVKEKKNSKQDKVSNNTKKEKVAKESKKEPKAQTKEQTKKEKASKESKTTKEKSSKKNK